jgi:hypothetical protein
MGSTELRAAAQQALEALALWKVDFPSSWAKHDEKAIKDLRTALAEPVQEPVASIYITPNGSREFDDWRHDLPVGSNLLYTAPPQRPAEPVQEPDLSHCPQCGGPADNGHDRSFPPSPYFCTKCMAEPVPVAWMHVPYPGNAISPMLSLSKHREPSLYAATVPLYIKEQL